MMTILTKIFSHVNVAPKLLQSKDMDLMMACELLQSASTDLKAFRNQFDEAKEQACVIAKKWNIATEFAQKRIKIVQKTF